MFIVDIFHILSKHKEKKTWIHMNENSLTLISTTKKKKRKKKL